MSDEDNREDQRRRASQMNELIISESSTISASERHRLLLEVHGFHPPIEEPEEAEIESLLEKMRRHTTIVRKRQAYNKALFLNPNYTDSRDFLLSFLRSENFNPVRAAQRLVFHFDAKLNLFGMDRIARKITYEDLNSDEKDALATQSLQILSQKDISGRTVIYESFSSMHFKSVQNQLRVHWYTLMSMIDSDIEAQKEGLVRISSSIDSNEPLAVLNEFIQRSSLFPKALPIRTLAIHFCYNNNQSLPLLSTLQLAVGTEGRLRLRDHFGTADDIKLALGRYNIQGAVLPFVQANEQKSTKLFAHYITLWKEKEDGARISSAGKIIQPLSSDVILGRGRHQQEHSGNLQLAELVDSRRQEYSTVRKLEKSRIIRDIVNDFQASGGRFLERHEMQDGIGWIEPDMEARRFKVSQLFRTQTKRNSEFFASAAPSS